MHNECTIKFRTLGATRAQIRENAHAINTNNAHVPFQNGRLESARARILKNACAIETHSNYV